MLVYKICNSLEWETSVKTGFFLGSSDDLRDGYIHLSTALQLKTTVAKHYAGKKDLLLIAFSDDDLGEALKWEISRGGELFPHLYDRLDVATARWCRPLPLGAHGHILPELDTA